MAFFFGRFKDDPGGRTWHIFNGPDNAIGQVKRGIYYKPPICGAYRLSDNQEKSHPQVRDARLQLAPAETGRLCLACRKRWETLNRIADGESQFEADQETTIVNPRTGTPFRKGDLRK